MIDDFCAEGRLSENGDEDGKEEKLTVYGKGKEKDMERPGNIIVHVRSSTDLQYLWWRDIETTISGLAIVMTYKVFE